MWLLAMVAGRMGLGRGDRTSDQIILERIARGESSALEELYDLHAKAVYSLALRILRDQADAEEILQDVFSQASRQASRYDASRGTVAAWLVMLTRSRAIDRLRTRNSRPLGPEADATREMADPSPGPETQLLSADEADRVRLALQALPWLQRAALELAYYEGLTHTEIAECLEQPLGSVKTRIRQGLVKLRNALNESKKDANDR